MTSILTPENYISNDNTGRTGLAVDRLQALQAFNARLVCMKVDESSYDEVVRGVWKVMGCDACALLLADHRHGELVVQASQGHGSLPDRHRISMKDETSIHAQSFNEEYLIHLDDLSQARGVQPLSAGFGSSLVLPVISNTGPVGVFDFSSTKAGYFTPQEIGMCSMLVDQMAYSLENIRLVGALSDSRDAVIRGMALLAEIRDSHIGGHLSRLCEYSRYLANKLLDDPRYGEVTPNFIDNIARSAALHDVGKVGIPDSILLKPGKLTDPEYDVMKSHTVIGSDLLLGLMNDFGSNSVIKMGAEVAISHHERWDGEGYPHGVRENDIPLAGRIVALADVYDALTSRRVYKDAWSQDETLETMRAGHGTQFDPILIDIFLENPQELIKIREKFPD